MSVRAIGMGYLSNADSVSADWLNTGSFEVEIAGRRHAAIVARATTLGDVVLAAAPKRSGADEITICDLSGMGVQDTAIAHHALNRVGASGCGR